MEPRIASLIDDSFNFDHSSLQPIRQTVPAPAPQSRRPHPVEPSRVLQNSTSASGAFAAHGTPLNKDKRSIFSSSTQHVRPLVTSPSRRENREAPHKDSSRWSKSAAPLAGVLNAEDGPSTGSGGGITLRDLLIQTQTGQHVPKRRRLNDPASELSSSTAVPPFAPQSQGQLQIQSQPPPPLTLPAPKPPLKKRDRRPRIPPLLQGLHQPPPDARLFPPITAEGGLVERPEKERPQILPVLRPTEPNGGLDRGKGKSPPVLRPTEANIGLDGVRNKSMPGFPPRGSHSSAEKRADRVLSEPAKASPARIDAERAKENGKDRHGKPRPDHEGKRTEEKPAASQGKDPAKRKRRRWTDEETSDLLKGVALFGIGAWKRILHCPDYTFNGRTAVDLKDRFRTCCPENYRKLKTPDGASTAPGGPTFAPAVNHAAWKPISSYITSNIFHVVENEGEKPPEQPKPKKVTHRKSPEELALLGIDAPFFKTVRRERREFTKAEDEALLRGYAKYGSHWRLIRKDPEFGLESRHPRDLRDRFRNRFPDKYAEAGYKVRPKGNHRRESQGDNSQSSPEMDEQSERAPKSLPDDGSPPSSSAAQPNPDGAESTANATAKPDFLEPLANFSDSYIDDPTEFEDEPVTLSREIFEWANQNLSKLPQPSTSVGLPPVSAPIELPTRLLSCADQFHVNPLVTLNLPKQPGGMAALPTLSLPLPIAGLSSGSQTSGLLNLPPPSDLLSGLSGDIDGRDREDLVLRPLEDIEVEKP